ncbi:MAG TPA: hypothetical protein VGL69_16620 [Solirubrobacteraceae bacterium]|jgi:hypothetical protein
MGASLPEQIADWLPEPAIRVAHRVQSAASPAELWRAASELTLAQSPVLGRLVQWRIPGTGRALSFDRLLREPPFLVLADGEDSLLSGLVGRIWTLRRDYPELSDPEHFRAFSERGSARVAIGVWAEPDPRGGALRMEARVEALGVQGQVGVAAVRPLVRGFQGLIGSEALRAAARRAESGG